MAEDNFDSRERTKFTPLPVQPGFEGHKGDYRPPSKPKFPTPEEARPQGQGGGQNEPDAGDYKSWVKTRGKPGDIPPEKE